MNPMKDVGGVAETRSLGWTEERTDGWKDGRTVGKTDGRTRVISIVPLHLRRVTKVKYT